MHLPISHFDDLLAAARTQPEPQRLLLVFAGVELPDDASPAERAGFAAGEGGSPVPLMCVDKTPDEIGSFAALTKEAGEVGQPGQEWVLVFTAALSGKAGRAPTTEDAGPALDQLTEAVRMGLFSQAIAFDRRGEPVRFGD
ncbi:MULTISPECIES: ribonucleotide reductase subunit alpha [unclassified Acidovorax]|uniref:ribonucleotide reductase subunit alpha n=1 Tax=unclassified Acidovorax TaxID=2684926 RepID=UPI0028831438|nr:MULTISPECIES: ribonucleotide reductase subunit alpha [unclassified Acidovorax]